MDILPRLKFAIDNLPDEVYLLEEDSSYPLDKEVKDETVKLLTYLIDNLDNFKSPSIALSVLVAISLYWVSDDVTEHLIVRVYSSDKIDYQYTNTIDKYFSARTTIDSYAEILNILNKMI